MDEWCDKLPSSYTFKDTDLKTEIDKKTVDYLKISNLLLFFNRPRNNVFYLFISFTVDF